MNGKREMIKELTNSAWSILAKYESDEKKGFLSREDAQKTAISRIQYIRYGEEGKDYFWITDMHPNMIMHPYRTDLNGKDLTSFKDPHGKRLFVEFVNTVKKSNHGYVDYMWQWKEDSLHIVPKLSYVKLFKPWNWIIGTGVYIEDVKKEISGLTKNMLWISTGITILIAFLLLYIILQSLAIERKRIEAEKKLHESREKYRTLVEAATEGLLMVIDGRISFANSVISGMTGYDGNELEGLALTTIVSKNNNKDIIDTFSKETIKDGQYELNIDKKNNSSFHALVTTTTTLFYEKRVNIIIIKNISIDSIQNFSNLDYQKLINTLNIGFFKAKMDYKGRFIFANETAIRILGFENFKALAEVHILDLLASISDRKTIRKLIIEQGFLKNKILKITKKNGDASFVAVSLIIVKDEDNEELLCDGIIEDITLKEKEKNTLNELICQLRSDSFMMEQSSSEFRAQVNYVDADSTLERVVHLFNTRQTDHVLLTKNEKDCIGIITSTDIQKRIIAMELNMDNPAYLIMSSPVIYIKEHNTVYDAFNICERNGIHHPIIKRETGEIAGVFLANDVLRQIKNSLSFFIDEIKKSETTEELKRCYRKTVLLVNPLIKSGMAIKHITHITTTVSDQIIKRLIELAIFELGPPPVPFSFICLGSEGRKEETLYTDQDNAIIYEDTPKEKEEETRDYFMKLGERVCNSLNEIGYSFCKGNIMSKNPDWCRPYSAWERYFINWVSSPEPQNLLDATIFFDFRKIYGDDIFTKRLENVISQLIEKNSVFLYHLAFNMYNLKTQQLSSGSVNEKKTELIELKSALIPIIMFARTYSYQHGIWETNTLDRLNALKEKGIISSVMIDEMIFTYNYLMQIRFRNQIFLNETGQPLSNTMNTKQLIDVEVSLLKKLLSGIVEYQNKIKLDFRINS